MTRRPDISATSSDEAITRRRLVKRLGVAAIGATVSPLVGAAAAQGAVTTQEIEEHLPASVVTSGASAFTLSASGVTLVGTADHTQLALTTNSAQTANVFVLKNSAGESVFALDPYGSVDARWNGTHPLHHLGNIAPSPYYAASHYFYGSNGKGPSSAAWSIGIDTAATVPYRDFYFGRAESNGNTTDFLYLSTANGHGAPAFGVGFTPPPPNYAMGVSGSDTDLTQGGIAIRLQVGVSGYPLAFLDSATGRPRLWLDGNGAWNTDGSIQEGVTINASGSEYPRPSLVLGDQEGKHAYGFRHGSNGQIAFRYMTGGADILTATGGRVVLNAERLGFFGSQGTGKPSPTGSKGGNTALASLLAALSSMGLVIDSST